MISETHTWLNFEINVCQIQGGGLRWNRQVSKSCVLTYKKTPVNDPVIEQKWIQPLTTNLVLRATVWTF